MTIHILEPTLHSTSGHCFTVVHSLAAANKEHHVEALEVWADKQVDVSFFNHLDVKTHAYFSRKIRRFQIYFLLRKLLKNNETVFLPTTSRAELTAFALLPRTIKNKGKVFFYIHQMRMDGAKKKRLQIIASKAKQAYILCTTEQLADTMREAGFSNVNVQLCPFEIPSVSLQARPFRHVIFPGIARMDKNFPFIARLVQSLQTKNAKIPCLIQAAPNHHGEFPEGIFSVIESIQHVSYAYLNMPCASLEGDEYLQQFLGGICLQPYIVEDYADKISGITLDALARGCPIIIRDGIHSAELVEKYKAGILIQNYEEKDWIEAIYQVIENYSFYQENCRKAFDFLSQNHHPARTLEVLTTSWVDKMPQSLKGK